MYENQLGMAIVREKRVLNELLGSCIPFFRAAQFTFHDDRHHSAKFRTMSQLFLEGRIVHNI